MGGSSEAYAQQCEIDSQRAYADALESTLAEIRELLLQRKREKALRLIDTVIGSVPLKMKRDSNADF
jgi:hypothetical protein